MEIENEKVEAVTTQPEAPQDETNEVVIEQPQEPGIDYAAEYEKEKERREKAEFALYKKKKAERAAKVIQEDTGVVDTDQIKKQVEDTFYAMNEAQREKDSEDLIDEEIMRLTSDPDERKLIRFKYDNAINKTGFSRLAIRQDMEDAQFLANKPRYLKEKKELAQTAISKKTITNSGGGTNLDRPVVADDLSKHFSKADWKFMQDRKFTPEMIKKAIPNK